MDAERRSAVSEQRIQLRAQEMVERDLGSLMVALARLRAENEELRSQIARLLAPKMPEPQPGPEPFSDIKVGGWPGEHGELRPGMGNPNDGRN